MPSNDHRQRIIQSLELLGKDPKPKRQLTKEYLEAYSLALKQRFMPYNVADSLDLNSIAAVCYYAEKEGLDVITGELPEITHKQFIANSLTRLYLTQMLNICGRECVYRPDLKPNTPWSAGHIMFPELMTSPSDAYIAALTDCLVQRGYKRPLVLQGGIQASSTPAYLFSKINPNGILDTMIPPEWKVSLVEDRFVEDMIEKFSILDVMQHGLQLFLKFDRLNFKSTYGIMKKYASEDLSLAQRDELRYIHVKLMRKYFDQLKEQMGLAKQEVKKLYLSQR